MNRITSRLIACLGAFAFVASCSNSAFTLAPKTQLQAAGFFPCEDPPLKRLPKKDAHTPTAACYDGTYSYSHNRREMRPHLGGVETWFKTLGHSDK